MGAPYIEFSPGVLFVHTGAKQIHLITYAHPMTFFIGHTDATSQADVARWRAMYALTPRNELLLSASISQTRDDLASLRTAAVATQVTAQPTSGTNLLELSFSEAFGRDLTPTWRFVQAAELSFINPIFTLSPQSKRLLQDNTLVLAKSFGRVSLAAEGRAAFFLNTAIERDGREISPQQDQVMLGAQGRFRWDISEQWSSELAGGIINAAPFEEIGTGVWSPTWRAALYFEEQFGSAALGYSRTVLPSVLTARNYLSDVVQLNGSIPLDRDRKYFISGSAGYTQSAVIDLNDGALTSTLEAFIADAAATWDTRKGYQLSVRYQRIQQSGDKEDLDPLPSFTRNTVMLTFGVLLPYEAVPRIPSAQSNRVDQLDRESLFPEPKRPQRPSGSQNP